MGPIPPNIAPFASLFRCPKCMHEAFLVPACSAAVACKACSALFSAAGGVLDFVSGQSDTALDVETYDQQRRVSLDTSRALFAHLKQLSTGAIPDHLGTVLEVGAGTGLLSIGMLRDSAFDRAIITDISPKMLTLCKERVSIHVEAAKNKIFFATYDASAKIFADNCFDLCIAHLVLHHIFDYHGFLADMCKALRSGGVAICVEPTALYHDAMARAMADSLCDLIAKKHASAADDDVIRIAKWIADVRYRLAFPDDVKIIRTLEDKHLFTRDSLVRVACAAGFESVTISPNFIDANGKAGAREYARQLGLSAPFASIFLAIYDHYAERYFRQIDTVDQSELYHCIFRRL